MKVSSAEWIVLSVQHGEKFYGPIIEDFYKKNPQGKDLANWKFQRYMRDYMKTVKSLDDNVGRVLDYLKEKDYWRIRW